MAKGEEVVNGWLDAEFWIRLTSIEHSQRNIQVIYLCHCSDRSVKLRIL